MQNLDSVIELKEKIKNIKPAQSGNYDDSEIKTAIIAKVEALEVKTDCLNEVITELKEKLDDLTLEYQGVEYLQSNGTQYINTGVIPTNNTRIVLDIWNKEAAKGYRMCGTQKDANAKFRIGTHTVGYWLIRYGNQENDFDNDKKELESRHTVELNKNKFILDGEVRHTFTPMEFTATAPIYLFAINDTKLEDNAPAKLYSCKIYQNDELVRDFVPCYHRLTKIIGLYDKVDKKLYIKEQGDEFELGEVTSQRWKA